MILHERRYKPMRLWIALYGLCVACEVHESRWNDDGQVAVTLGSAVIPWDDAQRVTRTEDAGFDAAVSPRDAAVVDAALSDAGRELDAGGDMPDAALDAASGEALGDSKDRCSFGVTTLALGGEYAPKNIGAIWIERSDGTWVKTLAIWAGVRLRYLTAYRAANPTGNKVDAVTSATLPTFRSHTLGWNLADAQGREVPEGDYRVRVEVTDHDGQGETLTVPFHKMAAPFMTSAPDAEHFRDIQLRCR